MPWICSTTAYIPLFQMNLETSGSGTLKPGTGISSRQKPGEKYGRGEEIKIPEMNVSGFLVDVVRIIPAEFLNLGNPQNLKPEMPPEGAD